MICQGCVEGTVYPVIDRPYVRRRKCVVCGGPIPEDAHGATRIAGDGIANRCGGAVSEGARCWG